MMFWLAAAAMTGLVCLALLVVLRPRAGDAAPAEAPGAAFDVAFYRSQLAEIDRQVSLGLIGPREGEAARTEAARRLIAASDDEAALARGADLPRLRRLGAVMTLLLVPAIGLGAYVAAGRPDYPWQPLASREVPRGADGQPIQIAQAIEKLEAHLKANPDDGRGHEVIAPVYLRLGRFEDAANAFAAALRLLGPTADRHASIGEALVFGANGTVTPDALRAFEAALSLEAKHIKSRFFLALGRYQAGDRPGAMAELQALSADLPDGPLKQEVDAQLLVMRGGTPGAPPAAAPAPGGAAGQAIAALPPAEQQAAVRGMVDNLAQRLATEGGTVADWARLIRALNVLGETERAAMIAGEAREKFGKDAEAMRAIEEAARAPRMVQ
jgi:cytochrome c-type biogenesis protein CcmH